MTDLMKLQGENKNKKINFQITMALQMENCCSHPVSIVDQQEALLIVVIQTIKQWSIHDAIAYHCGRGNRALAKPESALKAQVQRPQASQLTGQKQSLSST